MLPEEIRDAVKRLRRGPLLAEGTGTTLDFDRTIVERLIPHRDPFLFVDTIEVVDLPTQTVRGSRSVRAGDPVFTGHFPGQPVYPGVLVVEAIGQLGLTLIHFSRSGAVAPHASLTLNVRATRIHHAAFFAAFYPGDIMTLHAQVLASDLTVTAIGQAFNGEELAACAISEVYLDE
jgi:3-hydroxyacyl-[acyl-carrier-protein] dehydratase